MARPRGVSPWAVSLIWNVFVHFGCHIQLTYKQGGVLKSNVLITSTPLLLQSLGSYTPWFSIHAEPRTLRAASILLGFTESVSTKRHWPLVIGKGTGLLLSKQSHSPPPPFLACSTWGRNYQVYTRWPTWCFAWFKNVYYENRMTLSTEGNHAEEAVCFTPYTE